MKKNHSKWLSIQSISPNSLPRKNHGFVPESQPEGCEQGLGREDIFQVVEIAPFDRILDFVLSLAL